MRYSVSGSKTTQQSDDNYEAPPNTPPLRDSPGYTNIVRPLSEGNARGPDYDNS